MVQNLLLKKTDNEGVGVLRRIWVVILSTILIMSGVTGALANQGSESVEIDSNTILNYLHPEEDQLYRILIPGIETYNKMLDSGFDFAGGFERVPEGIEVDALLSKEQVKKLRSLGVRLANDSSPHSIQQTPQQATEGTDSLVIGRVDWFTTKGQGFLSVEAKTSAERNAELTLSWDSGSTKMSLYVDSGEYMYHRILARVDGPRPDTITVSSSLGAGQTAAVTDWLNPVQADIDRPGYESGFFESYKNPTEIYNRLDELAELYPDLAEVVELPYQSNGYRRHAQAQFGGTLNSTFYVTSKNYGHEGGNDISVAMVRDESADRSTVTVEKNSITVHLAGNSTASDVVNAINSHSGASKLVTANLYRNGNGSGLVDEASSTKLTDFLSAPAEISRDPFAIRAIRIGKHRDGSKPGVLIVAQDHAREWVTPLVALESAERLLANSKKDALTKQILNNVDILIIPSNNPDGAHYSFFDRNAQRRSMTNHCGPDNGDPGRRHNWGVDLNRNFSVGSVYDGYTGGSTSCTSDTYAGPGKLSEPEAKNVVWLAENYSNLKFFMTVHSYGGQLFWQPGSYKADGRITTPRPPLRDEQYYWQMAEEILSAVKSQRDTVVQPGNVGGSSDVLYSSAGNVREELYNNFGIYSFGWEVGGSQWDPEQERWLAPGGFQPTWEEAEKQYMEYSSGVMKMFELAMEYGKNKNPANTKLVREYQPDGSVNVTFSLSEPASVYYTTDGSKPTLDSPTYEPSNIREPGKIIKITKDTTFRWISVDVKGNVENEKKFTVKIK